MSFMTYVNQAKKVKSIVFVGWLRDALSSGRAKTPCAPYN